MKIDGESVKVDISGVVHGGEAKYDADADVMYFSWPGPQPCVCIEPMPGVLLRINESNTLVGVTIMGYQHRTRVCR